MIVPAVSVGLSPRLVVVCPLVVSYFWLTDARDLAEKALSKEGHDYWSTCGTVSRRK